MEVWRKAKVAGTVLFGLRGPAAISPEFRPFCALGPSQWGRRHSNVSRLGCSDLENRGSLPRFRSSEQGL